jgi:hypothetical protein
MMLNKLQWIFCALVVLLTACGGGSGTPAANLTGTAHAHAELTVIAGEVVSNSILQSARLQMPTSWKPLMVVSYKPSQQWTPSSEKPVLLKF